ncbi:ferredoxin [Tricholoma matsutake]|nr:ferredoxin [Tricholoma matsutake 945]
MFDTHSYRFSAVSGIRTSRSYASVSRHHCRTQAARFLQRPRIERRWKQLDNLSPSRTSWFSNSWIRRIHSSPAVRHGGIDRPESGAGIKVHFKDSKGAPLKTVEANEGDDLLSIAHEYDIDLEGACEGSVACSTCHVILPEEYYDKLPEPEDDENDMLDMAFGLTDTSRLGCQVVLTRDLDGITATLPSATRNMFVDGKKATH